MFPRTFKKTISFIQDFLRALDNRPGGHSMRKWLAVGFFWLTAVVTLRYTDSNNVTVVLGILTGMITALVITYTVGNSKSKVESESKTEENN